MSNPNDREIYNREVRRENQVIRENDSAASGLILGITLASLIGLGIGAFFLFNQKPAVQTPARNTIIEKTREVVPVPQPQAPNVNINVPQTAPPPAPNVNISVPSPTAPATQSPPADSSAPATAPASP